MTGLRDLLRKYRDAAPTQRDMGTAFERVVKVSLENAPTQRGQYGRVLRYADRVSWPLFPSTSICRRMPEDGCFRDAETRDARSG
jgi:predicted helicase